MFLSDLSIKSEGSESAPLAKNMVSNLNHKKYVGLISDVQVGNKIDHQVEKTYNTINDRYSHI